jgi:predicted nucleic acid-binding protein
LIVVADTSPLNYLVQMKKEVILHEIYGTVFVPPAVLTELRHAGAPDAVRAWASNLPDWVVNVTDFNLDTSLPMVLGQGEREAISLAMKLSATFVLLDDGAGRKAAKQRSLVPAGTLAILIQASERGLFDLMSTVSELKALGFRMSDELEKSVVRIARDLA